ncbi:hypothetical protein [Arachidicoccus terrestris]|uniref:hypothetical protein n=1 Tax=Arachidicoccus terrestris TaxID=2875539 RepID=UPI001CC40563|nr:hypothetical protein [Arachidicoccus terrestris]UAY54783.1 hypothetical protein K9M52_15245 [Arachidicoccus terrestris]
MKRHTSMSHFSGKEQQTLLRLKNKIVKLYKPLMVYLIGCESSSHLSRNCFDNPRNESRWNFSCDLLLILPKGRCLPENASKELMNLSKEYRHIRLLSHSLDFVDEKLQEYSLFFCWIQRRAIVLYVKDDLRVKLPEPVKNMKQYEKQAQNFFTNNPDYNGYEEIRLSPLPKKCIAVEERAELLKENLELTIKLQHVMGRFLSVRGASQRIRREMIRFVKAQRKSAGDEMSGKFDRIFCDYEELLDFFDFAESEILNQYKELL